MEYSHYFIGEDIPATGDVARCGFIVPVGWEARPHYPATDLKCPLCVAEGIKIATARARVVLY